ncbi:MAG: class II aldolase [Gammaproteobacteria bacterium]|nr:class II aldolase [Gammaproteobacteria bacterium]
MRGLEDSGLNHGAAGNASLRTAEGFLITPTGVRPRDLTADRQVALDPVGASLGSAWRPSSEWRFHCDIYRMRPEIGAIVHVHSPYATALATMRRDIPAFHYMISIAGGDSIRCAPYALFGSQALSDVALVALVDRRACLLANHGLIATGTSLQVAYDLTLAVEDLAHQYCLALQCGGPSLLSATEMTKVLEQFKTYGQQR